MLSNGYRQEQEIEMSEQILPLRLKNAREKIGITMAEAARRLNMSKIGYCRYEYGERMPSMQTLKVIAQCFGTSVDYLVGKTDDISSDCIVIHKSSSPELFNLVQEFSSLDNASQKRMLEYYKKITKKNEAE